MKTPLPLAMLLPIALAACTSSGPNASGAGPAATASTGKQGEMAHTGTNAGDHARQMLPRYHWQLSQAQGAGGARLDTLFVLKDKPLTLDFTDTHISVSNTCNRMGGSYQLQGDKLQIGSLNSTMMACSEPGLMELEKEVGRLLHGELTASLVEAGEAPVLTLIAATGDTLQFNGQPTAQTRYGSKGEKTFMEVAPQRVACNHPLMRNHTCLQVREITYNDNGTKAATGKWQPLYEEIEGYTFQPGIRNVLRLEKFQRKNPSADASSVAYVLDMVVESETVSP